MKNSRLLFQYYTYLAILDLWLSCNIFYLTKADEETQPPKIHLFIRAWVNVVRSGMLLIFNGRVYKGSWFVPLGTPFRLGHLKQSCNLQKLEVCRNNETGSCLQNWVAYLINWSHSCNRDCHIYLMIAIFQY